MKIVIIAAVIAVAYLSLAGGTAALQVRLLLECYAGITIPAQNLTPEQMQYSCEPFVNQGKIIEGLVSPKQ